MWIALFPLIDMPSYIINICLHMCTKICMFVIGWSLVLKYWLKKWNERKLEAMHMIHITDILTFPGQYSTPGWVGERNTRDANICHKIIIIIQYTKWCHIKTKYDMVKPAIQLLHRNGEIKHNSITNNSINQTKSDKPSEFTDVDSSFNRNQNQHRAPSNSLNNQWSYLSIDDITALVIILNICQKRISQKK